MKNMEHEEPDALSQDLCAYVLGEADEATRARVEAALAGSAELRAERDRLQTTVGMVRDAYAPEPALSDAALAQVLAAAGGGAQGGAADPAAATPPRGRLLAFPAPLRAAAAVLLVVGGVGTLVRFGGSGLAPASGPVEMQLAQADAEADRADARPAAATPSAPSPERAGGEVLRRSEAALDEFARGAPKQELVEEEAAPERRKRLAGRDVPQEPAVLEDFLMSTSSRDADSLQAERPREALDEARALYDGPVDPASKPDLGEVRLAQESFAGGQLGKEGKALSSGRVEVLGYTGTATREYSGGAASPAPSVSGVTLAKDWDKYTTGSDDFFLGRGQTQADGNYRGAGDTVPPGGAKRAKGLAEQGAAAGGAPAAPAAPRGGAAGALARPGGQPAGQRDATRETVERLRALGYIDTSDGEDQDGADGDFRGQTENFFGDEAGKRSVEEECRRRILSCYPRPNERPRDMYFRFWGDNAFALTELDRLSTFGVDVDTASYTLARNYLNRGLLPEKAQIRTEEFVNYFDADLAAPAEDDFAIHTELAPSRYGGREDRWMLRVGVRGREVAKEEREPLALTFVVDTSGSMKEDQRLELVKHAMRLLVSQLDARDALAIVAYSNEARLILPMTSVAQAGVIESAIHPLRPSGGTNAEAGLRMGYEVASAALDPASHARVVLLSDGVANIGETDQDRINAEVAAHRARGIWLNTIGVGMDNHNDVFLEQLANKGDGVCDYIDSAKAAQRAIVERFTGAFQPIGRDVKIQVEFDPAQVHRYRLLGYENRAIADADFRNDAVDAGEIGAGHQVVALYELERTAARDTDAALATVRLRWKRVGSTPRHPAEDDVREVSSAVAATSALGSFESASPGYRRSAIVAQFAEFLRRSSHARGDSFEVLLADAGVLARELGDEDFAEFATLVQRAYALGLEARLARTEVDRALDEFRRSQILRCEIERLAREDSAELLEALEQRNDELEERLRELLRRELGG